MAKTNTEWLSMSDNSIVSIIGEYVKHERLNQNKTQAEIAKSAGINRWTISKIENGELISLLSLIQILRALNSLHLFDAFKIETQISPLEMARLEKQKRQRARKENNTSNNKESEW